MKFQADQEHSPLSLYLREVRQHPLLGPEEEKKLACRVQAGDQDAKAQLIESNLRLVIRMARFYLNRGLSYMDLIEEGNLGLIHAAKKFDPSRNTRFSTYATWWIKQSLERAVINQGKTVRVPVHQVKRFRNYLKHFKEFVNQHHRSPTQEEMANHMHVSMNDLKKVTQIPNETISLQNLLFNDAPFVLQEKFIDTSGQEPTEAVAQEDLHHQVHIWLQDLEPLSREILERRFGLLGTDPMTIPAIAKVLDIPPKKVRQLNNQALRTLKHYLNEQGLNPTAELS